jgi:hypothetical protein
MCKLLNISEMWLSCLDSGANCFLKKMLVDNGKFNNYKNLNIQYFRKNHWSSMYHHKLVYVMIPEHANGITH